MKTLGGISALALGAFAATPVLAEVTAEQVWNDIETYMQGFGYSVTATETQSGDTLTVTDAVLSIDIPDADGSFSLSMDQIELTNRGDGTVLVTFPEVMPIAFGFVPEGEDDRVDIVLNYSHSGLELIVSGDPGALVYDYTADTLGMNLGEVRSKGVILTDEIARFDMTAGPIEGNSTVTRTDDRQAITQSMSLGNVTYDMAFNDPESDDAFAANGRMQAVSISGNSDLPAQVDASDPAALFASGMMGKGVFQHEGGQLAFNATSDGQVTNGQMSSTSGLLDFGMSGDSMTYTTGGTGTTLALTVPDMPFPINAQMASTSFNITVPLAASETPRDAALGLTLGGFTMSDMLWSMFDPGSQLPRDPATVELDVTAMVTPFVNLMDAEQMEQLEETGGVPGELNALTIKTLNVEAVGGKITGTGDFTFDNEDLESFDGMPAPEGKLEISVAGANGLIDKLIGMGLMAEEDAMGARMMLSMFTVPGSAEDTATSVIEFTDQGQILANGQRIK